MTYQSLRDASDWLFWPIALVRSHLVLCPLMAHTHHLVIKLENLLGLL